MLSQDVLEVEDSPPPTPPPVEDSPPGKRAVPVPVPVRLFGDYEPRMEVVHTSIMGKRVKGFKRGEKTYLPFTATVETFGLQKKMDVHALSRKKDRMGMPTYFTLPKEVALLRSEGIVARGTKRCVVMDATDMEEFLRCTMDELKMVKREESTSSDGKTTTTTAFVVVSEDDDDDSDMEDTPRKGGRRKTTYIEYLPDTVQQYIGEMIDFYKIELNHQRGGTPLAKETLRKTRVNITSFFDYCRRAGKDVSASNLLDVDCVNKFLFHLKEEKGSQAGTISNYCTALSRGVRYLRATSGDTDDGNTAKHDAMLKILTGYNNDCQRKAEQTRQTSVEVLKSKGQWLDW